MGQAKGRPTKLLKEKLSDCPPCGVSSMPHLAVRQCFAELHHADIHGLQVVEPQLSQFGQPSDVCQPGIRDLRASQVSLHDLNEEIVFQQIEQVRRRRSARSVNIATCGPGE